MTALLVVLAVIKMVLLVGLFVFLVGYFRYHATVKGSHGRYVARTILRYSQWLAVADQAVGLVLNLGTMDFWIVPINIYNLYWIGKFIQEFYDSDEDDWFKKTKRKLVKWGKRKLESIKARAPQLSPAPKLVPTSFHGNA